MGKDSDQLSNFYDDGVKEVNTKCYLNKYEYDLYREEDNSPGKVIQVKKIGNQKKGEKWRVIQDGKIALVIDGIKLTGKERNFLYTPEGISLLINQFKKNETSISSLKRNIKEATSSKKDL